MLDFISIVIIVVGIILVGLACLVTFLLKRTVPVNATATTVKGEKTWYNYTYIAIGAAVVVLGVVRLVLSLTHVM